METRIEKIPTYRTIEIGTEDKIIYITSDKQEYIFEDDAINHQRQLDAKEKYDEVCKKMKVKIFEIDCLEPDCVILKTTTLEDLHVFENYYSGYCNLTLESEFTANQWTLLSKSDGGDYKDDIYLTPFNNWIIDINKITEYVEKN